jgi:tetratricopeptide (TPR) repeat protein
MHTVYGQKIWFGDVIQESVATQIQNQILDTEETIETFSGSKFKELIEENYAAGLPFIVAVCPSNLGNNRYWLNYYSCSFNDNLLVDNYAATRYPNDQSDPVECAGIIDPSNRCPLVGYVRYYILYPESDNKEFVCTDRDLVLHPDTSHRTALHQLLANSAQASTYADATDKAELIMAQLNLAKWYEKSKNMDKALEFYGKAVKQSTIDGATMTAVGETKKRLKKLFDQQVKLGNLYRKSSNLPEAVACYRRIIKWPVPYCDRKKIVTKVRFDLATLCQSRSELGNSKDFLQEIVRENKGTHDMLTALLVLANMHSEGGDWQAAQDLLQQVIDTKRNCCDRSAAYRLLVARAQLEQAKLYVQQNQIDSAIIELEEVLAHNCKDATLGSYQKEAYQLACDIKCEQVDKAYQLGLAYYQKGEYELAVKQCDVLINLRIDPMLEKIELVKIKSDILTSTLEINSERALLYRLRVANLKNSLTNESLALILHARLGVALYYIDDNSIETAEKYLGLAADLIGSNDLSIDPIDRSLFYKLQALIAEKEKDYHKAMGLYQQASEVFEQQNCMVNGHMLCKRIELKVRMGMLYFQRLDNAEEAKKCFLCAVCDKLSQEDINLSYQIEKESNRLSLLAVQMMKQLCFPEGSNLETELDRECRQVILQLVNKLGDKPEYIGC